MVQSFEDAGKISKEFVDAGLKNFANVSKNVQALAFEANDYSRKAFEDGAAALEKLATARSLDKVFEVQSDYARQAYEGFVAQTSRLTELYADIAKDACAPFEAVAAKAK